MKTFLKTLALAASLGLVPAAALAQDAPAAQPKQQLQAQPSITPAPADATGTAPASTGAAGAAQQPLIAAGGADMEEPQTAALSRATPVAGVGQPDGRMGLQDQFTPIGEEAAWFHNVILLPLITAISVFVLILMVYAIIRYRRSAHPVPSRTTHNTVLEVVWTLVPVLILVGIALPSIQLLANQYSPPKADLTVKVIGNQWYWTYQYPDNGDFEIVSNMLTDKKAKEAGEPRMLGVDERMVVPAGATVKLIVTSADVIHSFGVPAFWTKMDAVPGRLNETWFKVDKPGLYYGQCYELCGARHAYMPIAVEVVPPAQYAAWVASKGGTMPGAKPNTNPDATQNSPIANPDLVTTGAEGATETSPEAQNVVEATTAAPVSTQGATNSRRGDDQ